MHEYISRCIMAFAFPTRYEIPIAGALWFLPASFVASIIFYWSKSNKAVKYIFLSWGVLITVLSKNMPPLPLAIDCAVVGSVFMMIGNLLKDNFSFLLNKIKSLFVMCFFMLIGCFLPFLNQEIVFRTNKYHNPVLFWIISVFLCVCWLLFSNCIECNLSDSSRMKSILLYIGQNTMCILVLNELFIKIYGGVIWHLYRTNIFIVSLILRIIVWALVLISCLFVDKIVLKTKFRFVLGKLPV